jgi:hypothetical protein
MREKLIKFIDELPKVWVAETTQHTVTITMKLN